MKEGRGVEGEGGDRESGKRARGVREGGEGGGTSPRVRSRIPKAIRSHLNFKKLIFILDLA